MVSVCTTFLTLNNSDDLDELQLQTVNIELKRIHER
jgi:hypothetical protein